MKIIPLLALASLVLGGCATQVSEGPLAPPPPVAATAQPNPKPKPPAPVSTPRPRPAPTPDPLAPAPLPQKPLGPGVSPLNHGPDQPLYQRQP